MVADQQYRPRRMQLLGQGKPDIPNPCTATRNPSRLSVPRRAIAVARMPANTPMAECGEGSPAVVVLVTCRVLWAMQSMSRVEVPLSVAVM